MKKIILLLSALLLTSAKAFADQNDAIVFNDFTVEQICVDNWDTNDDGRLSYAEAAAVKSLDGKFGQRFDIYTFNEFQYFTGVKETLPNEFSGSVFLREVTLPPSLRKLGDFTFYGCGLRKVTFNEGLEEIGRACFQECMDIPSLTLPESIVKIKEEAFMGCQGIREFRMPSKVREIGKMTFYYCIRLENISFNEALEKIHPMAFIDCNALKKVHFTKNINTAESAFVYCRNLQEFTVDSANPYFTAIDGHLYTKDGKALVVYAAGSPATEYKVHAGTEAIRNDAFCYAKQLVSIVLPENLTTIGEGAFYGCDHLQNVNLPQGISELKGSTFRDCTSLQHLELPSQLTRIDEIAFLNCGKLERISLPASLTFLGRDVFEGCKSMNEIHVYSKTGEIENLENSSLIYEEEENKTNDRTVYVPYGCLEVYQEHPYWKYAKEIKEMETTAIGNVASDGTITLNGMEIATSGNANIYAPDGTLVRKISPADKAIHLPAGIYVIKGKKFIVR